MLDLRVEETTLTTNQLGMWSIGSVEIKKKKGYTGYANRECLCITIDFNLPSRKVTALLDRLIECYGKPKRIRTDNGPEFTSKWFQLWLKQKGIAWSPIQKGSPQQNAIVERFNRTYREDVLDANLFASLNHARELTAKWRWEYNHEREHQSLNYRTPIAYAA